MSTITASEFATMLVESLKAQGITIVADADAPVAAPEKARMTKAEFAASGQGRTDAQKAAGRRKAKAIWAKHYKAAGVTTFKGLTDDQAKAAKAEVAAAWKTV